MRGSRLRRGQRGGRETEEGARAAQRLAGGGRDCREPSAGGGGGGAGRAACGGPGRGRAAGAGAVELRVGARQRELGRPEEMQRMGAEWVCA